MQQPPAASTKTGDLKASCFSGGHKRPPGRTPNGKSWDAVQGGWVDSFAIVSVTESLAVEGAPDSLALQDATDHTEENDYNTF